MATTTSDPDPAPDPRGKVVGKYKIFWNQPPPNKHIIVLQFPNRTPSQPYNSINGLKPLEMRIKPKSNLVEIDIPLYFGSEFDKKRGIEYGKALKNNRTLKAGGSLGFAGGFGIAGGSYARRRDEPEEQDVDMEGTTFEEEVAKGNVMDRFTLGGQAIIFNNTQPMYAIGVFHGGK